MEQSESFPEYTEEAALAYVGSRLPSETAVKLSERQMSEIIDLIFDYYDRNGLLDFSDLDAETDAAELAGFLIKEMGTAVFTEAEISEIVRLELEYEDSLNIF